MSLTKLDPQIDPTYIPGEDPSAEEDRVAGLELYAGSRPLDLAFMKRAEVMNLVAMKASDWTYFDTYKLLGIETNEPADLLAPGGKRPRRFRFFSVIDVWILRHLMVLRRMGAPYPVLQQKKAELYSRAGQLAQLTFSVAE